jgi:glycosyltransferase involved in cell wall biosynthesis
VEYVNARHSAVNRQLLSENIDEPVSAKPLTTNDSANNVVIFLAGGQSCVETAVYVARKLYPGRHIVYICESLHLSWFSRSFYENVLVVEQPFDPFGQRAAALIKQLEVRPIEACAIVIADFGFESFRFRVFALRLHPSRYLLLRAIGSWLPKPVGRISFALRAGATLFFRIILKAPGLDAFQKSVRDGFSRGLPKAIGRDILSLPQAIGRGLLMLPRALSRRVIGSIRAVRQRILTLLARWLPPLDQPIAVGLAWFAQAQMLLRSWHRLPAGNEVVHIIPHIGIGGVQKQLVLYLKNRSRAYNHRVVVLRSGDRFFAPELNECGVGIYYLDSEAVRSELGLSSGQQAQSGRRPLLKVVTSSLPFCCETIKLSLFLRRLDPRPDLVHCWLLYANLAGSIAARLAGVQLVVTSVRNMQSWVDYNYYDPRWQRALECATVPLASAITANAPAVAEDYRIFTGAPAEKVVTVPNGVDLKAFHFLRPEKRQDIRRTLGLTADNLLVGTVARLAKEKDFETFLRAVALAHPKLSSLRCVIVGEGPLRAHLEAFAASLGLVGVVKFLGERKDVGELVQCCDVFLLTSLIEGMPNAVMESQLLGVPVVATRAGGTVDLIRDGETGLLAPLRDYQTIASCIVRIFTEDGLRHEISRTASHQIRNGYTVDHLVARNEAVYRTLFGNDSGHGAIPCAE